MIKPRRREGREGKPPPAPPKGGKKKMLFFLRAMSAFAVRLILLPSPNVQWLTIQCQLNSLITAGFVTFPIALRGNSSSIKILVGTLYTANCSFAQFLKDAKFKLDADRNTNAAQTRSPHSTSSTPTTAHS